MATLEAIFIADVAKGEPRSIETAEVMAEGLVGDRYAAGVGTFSQGLADGRAVTLIAAEALEAIAAEFGMAWAAGEHRRNLVTRGIDLEALIHQHFRIGGVILRGNRPCPPCGHLSKLTGVDAKHLLHRRGGLRADVIEPGRLTVGDEVCA